MPRRVFMTLFSAKRLQIDSWKTSVKKIKLRGSESRKREFLRKKRRKTVQSTALYTPKMPPLGSQYATFGIPKGHLSAMKVPLLSTKTTEIIAQKSTDAYNHLTICTLRLHTFFGVIYEKSVGIFIQRSIEGLRKYKKKAQTTHHVAICQKAREYGVALDILQHEYSIITS